MKIILKNRSLLMIGFSESVSGIGTWITIMAVFSLVIFRGQGGVVQSSMIFMAGLLPALFTSLIAGWLCDRYDRKILMILSELFSGLAVLGILFSRSVEMIYILLAIQAATGSIMSPARQSSIPYVVKSEDLVKANALLQQLSSLVKIFGPILGGLVLAVLPARQAVILDVISYLLSVVILLFLPSLPPQKTMQKSDHDHAREEVVSPLITLLRGSYQLRLLYVVAFVAIQGIVAIDILTSVFTRDVLLGGEDIFGFEIGLIGLGTLLGSASLMVFKGQSKPWRDILGGLTLLALVPACMSFSYFISDIYLARGLVFVACFLGGLGLGRKMVQVGTLLQTLPPSGLLGRASGLFSSVIVASQIISTLAASFLVPAFVSIFTYYALVSGMILLAALIGLLSLRRPSWFFRGVSESACQE